MTPTPDPRDEPAPPRVWWHPPHLIIAHRYGGCYDVVGIGATGADVVGEEISTLPADSIELRVAPPCVCGDPLRPDIAHRQDGPCWVPDPHVDHVAFARIHVRSEVSETWPIVERVPGGWRSGAHHYPDADVLDATPLLMWELGVEPDGTTTVNSSATNASPANADVTSPAEPGESEINPDTKLVTRHCIGLTGQIRVTMTLGPARQDQLGTVPDGPIHTENGTSYYPVSAEIAAEWTADEDDDRDCGCRGTDTCMECTSPDDYEPGWTATSA